MVYNSVLRYAYLSEIKMSWSLYVKNIPPEITEEKLIIYFQSSKSGGGDVDLDACKWNGDNAVVVFEEEECK